MKFILGKKIGMTQVFLPSGAVVPVTKIQAGPCQIVAIKENTQNGIKAVQIGFGEVKESRLSKPERGHLKDLDAVRNLRDFTIEKESSVKRGDTITVDTFVPGDKVQVVGESKGKGFAGVVKRHHFRGGPASHGHKDNLRMPGSIGAGGVQRVFKGMRMGGRMGGDRVTIKNLEIVEVHPENGEIYIKGAVPGGRNALLLISGEGELKLSMAKTAAVSEVMPEAIIETSAEDTVAVQENQAV
jgi:large subunit ribosomal protein L3